MSYLDHAATTPMLAESIAALNAELAQVGNPSSLHSSGRRARKVVEECREIIAAALGARPIEIIFTGSGTEANNLAVKGLFWAAQSKDKNKKRILVSAVEHHAVLDPVLWLGEHEGAVVEILPVDKYGRVLPETLSKAFEKNPHDVALVTVMWANNEVGTVQPIAELVKIAHQYKTAIHSDAVQAVGCLEVHFENTDLDAMTVTGHKVGGPQGIGALVLKRDVELTPLLHGGGQERDVRSGTLAAPLIAGFAAAVTTAVTQRFARATRLTALRNDLIKRIQDQVSDVVLNGDPENRLPGNVHFSFKGCEGDALLMLLDAQGIECSTGSACSAGIPQPSHVLIAMGRDEVTARASIRFSFGATSTPDDVDAIMQVLPAIVERAKRAGKPAAKK
ncbi:MAG: cysteine desulfurase [Candidatus Nanopelagicales bacterium]|nr:cysteine desulfurase [Candidatus Nanopelagicales bacterium]